MRPEVSRRVWVAVIGAVAVAFVWDDIAPWARALSVLGLSLLLLVRSDQTPPLGTRAAEPSSDILDRVVADDTRHPWSPTTLPWLPTGLSPKPVLLVPAADYHLVEVVGLARELNRIEIPTRIAIGPSPWARTWPALSAYPDLEVHELPSLDEKPGVSAVVVMKDTGTLGPFVDRCRELGIPTLGKVEGAQDFWDADTPEQRRPYRNLDHVLCQGDFDSKALDGVETTVVGSTRLERLWWAPSVSSEDPMAVINLNFVYGVRTEDRSRWLETAIAGCEKAGVPYVISVHPAERARITSDHVTSISASRLLPRSSVLISRFSTMPLEAMARGVPFIYYNPHGETVATYADPMGAYDVTTTVDSLATSLARLEQGTDVRLRVSDFFNHHVDIERDRTSEQRGAEVIARHLVAS